MATPSGESETRIVAPFGLWKSPLQGESVYAKTTTITDLLVDETTGRLFFIESRPTEGGRFVLMESRLPGNQSQEELSQNPPLPVVPTTRNVRSSVHEYGGGAAMVANGYVYISEFDDGRIWRRRLDDGFYSPMIAISPESNVYRYADFDFHPTNPNVFICIREDHSEGTSLQVKTSIVCVDTFLKTVRLLVPASKEGFYACPRFGGVNGSRVAWIEWKHPNLPWDGSELFCADFKLQEPEVKYVLAPKKIAGENGNVSINDVKWSSAHPSRLFYLSDETGFSNLWSIDVSEADSKPELAMNAMAYDLGEPLWRLAPSWYAIMNEMDALIAPNVNGRHVLCHLDLSSRVTTAISSDYTDITDLRRVDDKHAALLACKWDSPKKIVLVTLGSLPGEATFLEEDQPTRLPGDPSLILDKAFISSGEHMVLKVGPLGKENARSHKTDLHVTLYRPTNPHYRSLEGKLPPTLVQVHGGPTARAVPGFNIFHQYFTTRGFVVLDVDYSGSSGYGREYQKRLYGAWGKVDAQDTISAVEKLSELGLIDGKRVAIRGSSAGGFTALKCLTESEVFSAGINLYGITDIKTLVGESSKFEAHYASRLIGGTLEEVPEVYEERSPINRADKIKAKLLMFQGLKDKVVSPEQTRKMAEKIRSAGGSVETVFYPDEGHKIRKAENLTDSLIRTEAFLKEAFGLV